MTVRTTMDSAARWLRLSLLAAAPVLLAACGGGGQVAEGGIIGTGITIASVGAVSALGPDSVTVNGVSFRALAATVTVDGQPATQDALKVGQVVTVQGQTLPDGTATAQSIAARDEIKGIVSGVDNSARSFTVLGQRVRTDDLTVFAGGTFATLLNQYVEVSGFRAAPGDVLATRVDISAAPSATLPLEVAGVVSAFDAGAKTFMIGTQLVDFSQVGAAFLPAGLANGVVADVRGAMVSAGGRLIASDISLLPTKVPGSDNSNVELEGIVTDFAGLASFRVNGQLIDGRGAMVTGGTSAMVADGAKVEVEGKLAGGVVVAAKIDVEQQAEIMLDATVEAIDATGVTLGGQRVAVAATTQFEDRSAAAVRDFGLAAVRVGDRLQVSTTRGAAGLVAARVVRVDTAAPSSSGVTAQAEGAISDFMSLASFKVAGQKVNASSARFEGGVAGDLANGRRVNVEGVLAGDVLLATRVALESEDTQAQQSLSIEGSITDFVSRSNFTVSGRRIDASQATFGGGAAADLANGRSVAVAGVLAGEVLVASTVSFRSAPPAATLEIEGAIANFSSIASFKVAGQAVDASNATLSNGKAADLADGRLVTVVGPVVGGVLQATTVEIKDAPELTEANVRGTITNFVSIANFTVAARRIDASKAKFEGGSAAKLANGVQVEVEGKLVGTTLVADTVTID